MGSVLLIFLSFCVFLLCVFTFWVPCCDVRYEVSINVMFSTCSSLSPVICRRTHVLFTLYVLVCAYWCPTHIMLCFCFGSGNDNKKRTIQFLWIVLFLLSFQYSLTLIAQLKKKHLNALSFWSITYHSTIFITESLFGSFHLHK